MISRSLRTALTFWVGLAVAHSVGHAQTVSPTEIAFYRACSNNPAKACLAVVNEDGTSLNELVDPDRYPQGISTDQGLYDTFAWSPDGTSIAFSAALTDRFGLFTVPGRGGPATFVAPGGRNPSWSPDSGRIAYAAVEPSGEWNIYVVAAAGGTPVRLTNGGDNRWPQWSADGTQISFLRSGLLQVMNADGTGLTSLAAALSPGRWSSDSARLTFTCGGFASARVSGVCAVRRDAAEFEVLTGNGEGGRALVS